MIDGRLMKTKAAAGSEKATEICCHPADLPPQVVHAKACAQVGREPGPSAGLLQSPPPSISRMG